MSTYSIVLPIITVARTIIPLCLLGVLGSFFLQPLKPCAVTSLRSWKRKINSSSTLLPLACLIAGIVIQQMFVIPVVVLSGLLAATSLVLVIVWRQPRNTLKLLFLSITLFVSGAALTSLQTTQHALVSQLWNKRITTLEGIAAEVMPVNQDRRCSWSMTRIRLNVTKATVEGESLSPPSTVLCYLSTKKKIHEGDALRLSNVRLTSEAQPRGTDGLPTFTDYLVRHGVLCSVFASNKQLTVLRHATLTISNTLSRFRERLFDSLKKKLSNQTFSYFAPLFLGNKTEELTRADQPYFNFWGVTHFLARSGLHVALFVLLWTMLTRLLPVPLLARNLILLSLFVLYYALSWSSASFIRAASIFTLSRVAAIAGLFSTFVHTLVLVCIVLLMFNPINLLFLDFQLTFGLTMALGLFFAHKPLPAPD